MFTTLDNLNLKSQTSQDILEKLQIFQIFLHSAHKRISGIENKNFYCILSKKKKQTKNISIIVLKIITDSGNHYIYIYI